MKKIEILFGLLALVILSSCGKGTVKVTNDSYEPSIVIGGYLIAGQKNAKVQVSGNFRVNQNLRRYSLIPEVNKTLVTITDLKSGKLYELSFHDGGTNYWRDYYWEYMGNDFNIECSNSYRLDVHATIDGKELYAFAVTTVPENGFKITGVNHDSLSYREKDNKGELKHFEVVINRSPGTTFYLITTEALDASYDSFIYDNPYEDVSSDDVDLIGDKFDYEWIQNTPETAGKSLIRVFWTELRFYGEYKLVVYAADKNYREFLQTYNNTQEVDGNFHEPKFNVDGDGIGVFGSVIADSVYINVLK